MKFGRAVFGRPLQVTVRTTLRDRCPVLSVCPVCNVGVLWQNGWMDQDTNGTEQGPRPRRYCVRLGPPHGKEHNIPHFSAHVYCRQTAGWNRIKIPLDTKAGLGPGDIVLDGDPAPPREKAQQSPSFRLMSIEATVARLSFC